MRSDPRMSDKSKRISLASAVGAGFMALLGWPFAGVTGNCAGLGLGLNVAIRTMTHVSGCTVDVHWKLTGKD